MILAPHLFLLKPFNFSSPHPKFHQVSGFLMPSQRNAKEPEYGDRGLREDVSSDATETGEHIFSQPNIIYEGKLRLRALENPQSTERINGDTMRRLIVLPQTCMERIIHYFYPQRQKPKFPQAFGYSDPWGYFQNSSKPVQTYYSWKTLTYLRHITSHMSGHKGLPLFFYTEIQHWQSNSQIPILLRWGSWYRVVWCLLSPSICLSLSLFWTFPFL